MSEIKVITSVQRRRRWRPEEKRAMVEEAEQPGMSISAVARKYDVHPQSAFYLAQAYERGGSGSSEKGRESGSYL